MVNIGIYRIRNRVNQKSYIGKSVNLHKRKNDHLSDLKGNKHHNTYLQRSWDKYGEENFEFSILERCAESVLNEKEVYYISKYKTNNAEFGYNLTDGGDGSQGFKHTEESKRKISEVQIGKKLSEEHKKKISDNHKGKIPKNINILLESNIKQMISIIQFNSTGDKVQDWESIQRCSRETGLLATNIVKCLKGNHKTCGGYVFIYKTDWDMGIITRDDIIERFIPNKPVRDSVVRLNLNSQYIDDKKSIQSYAELGYDKNKIAYCCKGIIDSYDGYKWMYMSDFVVL